MAIFESGTLRTRGWDLDGYLQLEENAGDLTGTAAVIKNISSQFLEVWVPETGETWRCFGKFTLVEGLVGKSINQAFEESLLSGTITSLHFGKHENDIFQAEAIISGIKKSVQEVSDSLNSDLKIDIFAGDDVFYGNDFPQADNGNPITATDDAGNLFNGNRFHGFNGNDTIHGGALKDSLWGDMGNDVVWGYSGDDFLYGGVGNDKLYGGEGSDKIVGGTGKDLLVGGIGSDSMYGGTGDDTYVYGFQGADVISDSAGVKDVLVIENMPGAQFNWTGSTLEITEKADATNKLSILDADGTGQVEIVKVGTIEKYLAKNQLGSSKADLIIGLDTSDTINAGLGDDVVIGGIGNDSLYGGAGNDEIYGENDNDLIYGELGNDKLLGDDGSDTIYGGLGIDTLFGGEGNDLLFGGAGKDTLSGNDGADTFAFNTGDTGATTSTRDVITDFLSLTDKIDLSAIDANTASKAKGDQAFSFNETTAKANSIWYKVADVNGDGRNNDVIVYGDVNGNTTADFQIALVGVVKVEAADFVL